VLPGVEFKVEEDLAVGTVRLESAEESVVRKLALDRRRSSLKKGIATGGEVGREGAMRRSWTVI
jgi:hypothetical protein